MPRKAAKKTLSKNFKFRSLPTWDSAYKVPSAIIAFYLRKAHRDKLWAADLTPSWYSAASNDERARAVVLIKSSVREIARAAINERRLIEADKLQATSGFTVPWVRYHYLGEITVKQARALVIPYEPINLVNPFGGRPDIEVIGDTVTYCGRRVATILPDILGFDRVEIGDLLATADIDDVSLDEHEQELDRLRDEHREVNKEQDEQIAELEEAKIKLEDELDAVKIAGSGKKRLREIIAERDLQKARAESLSSVVFAQRAEISALKAKLDAARRSLRESPVRKAPPKKAIRRPVLRVVEGGRKSA